MFQNPTQEAYTTFPYAERGRSREEDDERRRDGTNIFVLVLRVILDKLALFPGEKRKPIGDEAEYEDKTSGSRGRRIGKDVPRSPGREIEHESCTV